MLQLPRAWRLPYSQDELIDEANEAAARLLCAGYGKEALYAGCQMCRTCFTDRM